MPGLPGRGGLPGHQVIPTVWEQHHRPVAEATHTVEVLIQRHTSAATTFDAATGRSVFPTPVRVWRGHARVQRMAQMEIPRSIGDRQVIIRGYTVSITTDAPPVMISDEVVTVAPSDAVRADLQLVGESLWVHDVRYGSLLWQRDLVCLNAPPTAR